MAIITKSVRLVWRNPYVTNGLVAMWDGQWNTGIGGNSDPSVTNRWTDLIGGRVATATVGSLVFDGTFAIGQGLSLHRKLGDLANVLNSGNLTLEFAYQHTDSRGYVFTLLDPNLGFEFWNNGPYATYLRAWDQDNIGHCGYGVTIGGAGVVENASFAIANKNFSQSYKCGSLKNNKDFSPALIDYQPEQDFYVIGNPSLSWTRWTGRCGSIRLYNRALSADEIAYNATIDAERFNINTMA